MNERPCLIGVLLVLLAAGFARGEDWPQWRGPGRTGATDEPSGHPAGWPPKQLWAADVGRGGTSPILADGKVFVLGWQGRGKGKGDDGVFCLDAATGKQLWKQTYASRYYGRHATGDKGRYGGPNSTPTYDPQTKRLYTLGLDGDFCCWDVADGGKRVWAKNLYDEFRVPQRPNVGGGKRDFGFSSAPLIHGDVVILDVGGRAGLVIAFDKGTGAVRWQSQSKELAGSSGGPAPMAFGNLEAVASLGLTKLVVTRIDKGHEGQTLAETRWQTQFACNIATPGVAGDHVVLTSAYNVKRTALFRIAPGRARQAWKAREHCTVSSPVVHGGKVFLAGGALTCLDAGTGRKKWSVGNLGQGGSCIATGDGKLIGAGRGRVILVEVATGKQLAEHKGVPSGWPSVAFGDGIILCKDDRGKVVALSVKQRR